MPDLFKTEPFPPREQIAAFGSVSMMADIYRLYNMWVQVSGMIGANSEFTSTSPMKLANKAC